MVVARFCLAALAFALLASSAQAQRSRLGEEDVAKPGDCELDLAASRQSARGAAAERESALQLDCGIGWRTELVVGVVRRHGGGGRADAIELEARTALFQRGGVAWSVVYGAAAERRAGASWRGSGHRVGIDAAWRPAEAWVLDGRIVRQRDRIEGRSSWVSSFGLEHELSDRAEARLEIEDESRSRPLLGLELRYEFWPDRARLGLSYAARAGAARERRWGLGVTFEF